MKNKLTKLYIAVCAILIILGLILIPVKQRYSVVSSSNTMDTIEYYPMIGKIVKRDTVVPKDTSIKIPTMGMKSATIYVNGHNSNMDTSDSDSMCIEYKYWPHNVIKINKN